MNRIEEEVWAWHVKHYGDGVNLPDTYAKLCEEVGELGKALILGPDEKWGFQDARMEAGDVAVLLFVIYIGLGGDSLVTALANVMTKLASSEWQEAHAAKRAK